MVRTPMQKSSFLYSNIHVFVFFEDMMDNDDEVEDEANEEVDKVMDELALDVLDKTPNAPANVRAGAAEAEPDVAEAEDPEMRKMQERFDSLKGGM
jgi:division protein CdvB (Snf7/Vps24/ESCRT-III family)